MDGVKKKNVGGGGDGIIVIGELEIIVANGSREIHLKPNVVD